MSRSRDRRNQKLEALTYNEVAKPFPTNHWKSTTIIERLMKTKRGTSLALSPSKHKDSETIPMRSTTPTAEQWRSANRPTSRSTKNTEPPLMATIGKRGQKIREDQTVFHQTKPTRPVVKIKKMTMKGEDVIRGNRREK